MTNITEDIKYIGVNDREIDLFEGQYEVPNGMAYNSYVILDEKVAVMDTVDRHFTAEWLKNLESALAGRQPDYLIVQHMEPDHSAGISEFSAAYPDAVIVGNDKTFTMIKNFYGGDFIKNSLPVKNGDTLSLGEHELNFVFAPMVHWPEVMMTYDTTEKALFSADAFGTFGAMDGNIFADEVNFEQEWLDDARRYYTNIVGNVGKYGGPVQTLLKKAAGLDIAVICPLHGPVLSENLGYYLNLYDIWSSYGVESEGVCIAYTSVYGNTKKAVEYLAEQLRADGCTKVAVNDLARCDMAEAVEDAFRYGKLVLATTTYNGSIFPFMRDFIDHLTERGYQKRTVAFIENGSWAPTAARNMAKMFENSKDIEQVGTVTIRSAMTDENKAQLDALAKELA